MGKNMFTILKKIFLKNFNRNLGDSQRYTAFTLAEVLITLGIIGTVAAITIPNLILEQRKRGDVVKVKKIYSTLSQATLRAMAENGPVSSWGVLDGSDSDINKVYNYYKPYLKIAKDCGNNGVDITCWNKTFSLANIVGLYAFEHAEGGNDRVFELPDGTSISLDMFSSTETFGVDGLINVPVFFVDINGPKTPNQFGKDVFAFVTSDKGLLPSGKDNQSASCTKTNNSNTSGIDCAAKVLLEDKISYY